MTPKFVNDVVAFNQMYGLPVAAYPTTALEPVLRRMERFMPILGKELMEGEELVANVTAGQEEIDTLTEMADWLGDIIVYCTSESLRYGIPIVEVLSIIMESNASKLDADGKSIILEGKVQKGPHYWRPEPRIKELLLRHQVVPKKG